MLLAAARISMDVPRNHDRPNFFLVRAILGHPGRRVVRDVHVRCHVASWVRRAGCGSSAAVVAGGISETVQGGGGVGDQFGRRRAGGQSAVVDQLR